MILQCAGCALIVFSNAAGPELGEIWQGQGLLDEVLARLGVSHLVLAGASSSWCMRATAYGALERGYGLTLVADAHSTSPMDPEDGPRIEAETVVRELNIALTWLSCPGRKSAAVPLQQLSFTPD